jgi:hypothetical protein
MHEGFLYLSSEDWDLLLQDNLKETDVEFQEEILPMK